MPSAGDEQGATQDDGLVAPGTLAPVYVRASYASAGRGLLPLPDGGMSGTRALLGNLPLWALTSLFLVFTLLWSTTVARVMEPDAVPLLPLLAGQAGMRAAAAELLRHTAVAFPNARSVILAHLHVGVQGEQPWWTLVEVDGKALRASPSAVSVEAALAAAGVQLADGDRVLVVPNEGAALASGARGSAGTSVASPLRSSPSGAVELPARAPLSIAPTLLGGLASGVGATAQAAHVVVQRAVPFTVQDAGVPSTQRAAATTVGEALHSVGIDVESADLVQPEAETPLVPGMKIAILRALAVTITGPNLQLETRSRAATVGELLQEQGVALGPLDRVEPPAEESVPANGAVRVVRGREDEQTELRAVPFQTETEYNDRLIPGSRVRLRAGVNGLVQRVIRVVFENDVEVRRYVAEERVVRDPVNEIMAQGPGVISTLAFPFQTGVGNAPPDGTPVRRVLMMETTAYEAGPASTGKRPGDPGYGVTASGMRAAYGVVAVDPRVIPFYTRLYIPGYGFAIAADTGSAILGNRVDLFFNTYGEAVQWGRKVLPVYIVG